MLAGVCRLSGGLDRFNGDIDLAGKDLEESLLRTGLICRPTEDERCTLAARELCTDRSLSSSGITWKNIDNFLS